MSKKSKPRRPAAAAAPGAILKAYLDAELAKQMAPFYAALGRNPSVALTDPENDPPAREGSDWAPPVASRDPMCPHQHAVDDWQLHNRDTAPAPVAPDEPTDAQIRAGLKAACMLVTPTSVKDMTAAYKAMAAPAPVVQPEPLNLADKAVQKRLAAQWGFVPAAPVAQPEPVELKEARRVAGALMVAAKVSKADWTYAAEIIVRLTDMIATTAAPAPVAQSEVSRPYGACSIHGPKEDVAFILRHLPDVDDAPTPVAQTDARGSIWFDAAGRALGRVSDEQIEAALLYALANVRARAGLQEDPVYAGDERIRTAISKTASPEAS